MSETPLTAAPALTGGLGDRAARGSSIVLGGQAVKLLLQFASLVLLSRLLTPTEFGLVAMVVAVTGIADLLRDFGLSSAAIQSRTLSKDERTNLFWANCALGALCTALVSAAAPLIVALYGQPALGPIVLALAWVFLLSGINTQFRADLTRSMRYPALAVSDIGAQAVAFGAAVVLALNGAGVWAIVVQQLVTALLGLVINVVAVRWLPGRPRRRVSIRRFFRFGGNLFAAQTLTYLTKNVDNIALGIVSGPYQLGLYSRAYQLLMAPLSQVNAPMTGVALPVLSRLQDDKDRFDHYLTRAQLVACYLTASIFAVSAGVAEPLVTVLFGEGWEAVAPIFAILAVGGVFRSIQQIAFWTYMARGETGAQLRMILVTRPIMIVIILAGLPWGPIGVAVGHSVAFFLFWIVSTLHAGRVTGVDGAALLRNAVRPVLLVSLPAGLLAYAVSLVPAAPIVQTLAGIVAGVLCFAVIALLNRAVRGDVRILAGFVRRAFARRRAAGAAR
jgi:PST family polysaccharide transporter